MRLPPCACNTLALSAHRAHAWPGCKGFLHNSPHTHPQKRGGKRQDHDICLCLNEIQNSAEMQAGGRSLFLEQHAPKRTQTHFSRPNWLVRQNRVYTLKCTYTSLLPCTQIHRHTIRVFIDSLCGSHIHKQIDKNTGFGPYSHGPLCKLISGFRKNGKRRNKGIISQPSP